MLYIYLLDRLKLSLSSNWFDEENNQVYMYFKREEMQKALKLTAKTVIKVVGELKAHNLMTEKVQGINLPNRIFLFAPIDTEADNDSAEDDDSDMENLQSRTGNNSTSEHGNTPTPDMENFHPIKNESNKNKKIKNEDTKNEGKTTTTNAPTDAKAAAEAAPTPPPDNPPFDSIKEMYNSICHGLRGIVSINGKRKTQVAALFKDYGIDGIKTLFEKTAASDFLHGSGERGWKADFDWLINSTNMQKVLEGKYDNDQHPSPPLSDTGEGFLYVPVNDEVIEMPLASAAATSPPDFPVIIAPNPARAVRAAPAPYSNYRNKNGFNTMGALQKMLEAEQAKEGRVAV
jgi:hypothetical protein